MKMHPYRKQSDMTSDFLAVVYVDGETTIETILAKTGRSMYGRKTVSEIRASHVGKTVSVLPIFQAMERVEAAQKAKYCNPLAEITEDQFLEALNCLPPENWKRGDGWEAFRMSEYTCGRIATHFLMVGDRYFSKSVAISSSVYDDMMKEASKLPKMAQI